MRAYYSEFDPQAAAWLRELMADGLITPGVVDERDIRDVAADDVRGFDRVHFFAGVGGWDHALDLAGWGDAPVWTGSCPCQPFSSAGRRKGKEDKRHLWPAFFRLIRECRPRCVFGEQVEGAIRHGWLDGVCADLEAEGYAVGSCVLGAHSVGAPHIRQRLYWVAQPVCEHQRGQLRDVEGAARPTTAAGYGRCVGDVAERCSATGGMADADRGRAEGEQRGEGGAGRARGAEPVSRGTVRGLGDAEGERREGSADGDVDALDAGDAAERHAAVAGCNGSGFWSDSVLIPCRDGKWRRVPAAQPGVQPVADGLPAILDDERGACGDRFPLAGAVTGRVALLRGAGNAIVPQVAAEFIRAFLEDSP
ncbi:MAG TPA: DNA cytosine methyltransferase [Gemmata sp.]|nr:DNA cytosine methyltransferase [Gemmata sp.]